jgi:hypothetical protein
LPLHLFALDRLRERTQARAVAQTRVFDRKADLVFVTVRESVYPGGPDDVVPVEGKWLYVISEGKVVVTVDAAASDRWSVDNTLFPEQTTAIDGSLKLKKAKSYAFFVAPIRLTENAKKRLVERADQCRTLARLSPAQTDVTVSVRDPFLWALDLHHQAYRPALDEWRKWVYDTDRVAELFIASGLKCLIAAKDPLDIANELRQGEPEGYLQKYETDELSRRRAAEDAMAKIANVIDSEEHRLVEAAAMELGGSALEQATIQWAATIGDMLQTLPGRQLAARLAVDETRLPLKYLFTKSPPANIPPFATSRYLSLAGFAIVKDLAPAVAEVIRQKRKANPLDIITEYLSNLSEEKSLTGTYRRAYKNIENGLPLTKGIRNAQEVRKKLLRKAFASEAATRLPPTIAASNRMAEAYERNFAALHVTLRFALEVVNLACAIGQLNEMKPGDSDGSKALKVLSVVGASADFATVVTESAQVLLEEAGQRLAKKALAVTGIVSGICDCISFIASTNQASDKYDYNQAVGHAIAAAGALGIVVGSSMMLGSLLAADAALAVTGVGMIVAVIGSALVAAGSFVAWICTDNAFEQFAKVCFLGKHSNDPATEWDWTAIKLPIGDREKQAAAFVALLSNFRISLHSDTGGFVYPGYYQDGDVLEIYVEERYRNYPMNAAMLEVDLGSGDVRQVMAIRSLLAHSRVQFDGQGRAETVFISCDEEAPASRLLQFQSRLMRARLLLAGDVGTVPPKAEWVEAEFAVSLGADRREATSLDQGCRANLKQRPMAAEMVPAK